MSTLIHYFWAISLGISLIIAGVFTGYYNPFIGGIAFVLAVALVPFLLFVAIYPFAHYSKDRKQV